MVTPSIVITVTRLIPGVMCYTVLMLTFTGDDDFHRLCSVKFQVVGLCPFFNVVRFGFTRLDVKVQVRCRLHYPR